MAPTQQARVLRCCYCRLFQVHQVKKSLKWTCKACGEKQSFLRAYGEGSAADCRCHVQKLNLLQGQSSEMSLRSLGEPGRADDRRNAGPQQAERASLQEKPQPSENHRLKYLERDAEEAGLEGECFSQQSSPETENPDPPFNKDLPRKRKWNQNTVQLPHNPDVQESSNSEVTWNPEKAENPNFQQFESQAPQVLVCSFKILNTVLECPSCEQCSEQGQAVLAEVQKGSSCEDWDTWGQPSCPAQQIRATSKWRRFLLSPENSSCVHMEPPIPQQRTLKLAQQGIPRPPNLNEGHLRGSPCAFQLLQTTHTPTSRSKRVCGKTPEQSEGTGHWVKGGPLIKELPLVRLCDLFKTDEDFDDNL